MRCYSWKMTFSLLTLLTLTCIWCIWLVLIASSGYIVSLVISPIDIGSRREILLSIRGKSFVACDPHICLKPLTTCLIKHTILYYKQRFHKSIDTLVAFYYSFWINVRNKFTQNQNLYCRWLLYSNNCLFGSISLSKVTFS